MGLQHYAIFRDHTTGMQLYRLLLKKGIHTIMAPTPRSLSLCCGLSLLVKEEDLHNIRMLIEENGMIVDIATIE